MPKRKATGVVVASAPSSAAKHKRQASVPDTPRSNISTPPTRSSKRTKTVAKSSTGNDQTPKKSKYFEHPEDDVEEGSDGSGSEAEDPESGYEDQDNSAAETGESSAEEDDDDYDSDEDKKRSKKGSRARQKANSAEQLVNTKNDLWREGVKTGLGPGKQVFIEKPKARGDGGIKYVPERIHPHTFEFLKDLKKNNDRIWFKAHDADYRASWKDFESFVESLTEKIAEVDETIPELPPKDLVFRIYRDIRFSSDPTPYKPHFSAAWSRTGRKGPYACYYVHIQPGEKCFVGSGLWHPEADPVKLLRADIDQRSSRIRTVLTNADIRKHIFGGIGKDQNKAIKAFCKQNEENALKTKPKVPPQQMLKFWIVLTKSRGMKQTTQTSSFYA